MLEFYSTGANTKFFLQENFKLYFFGSNHINLIAYIIEKAKSYKDLCMQYECSLGAIS
jgi:hypothetical protein